MESRSGRRNRPSERFQERLAYWAARTPGKELLERERRCVETLMSDLFGYYVLQVGWGREFRDVISQSRIRQHIVLDKALDPLGGCSSILADDLAFPVASDSVDAVFLPHTLDFSQEPRQVLCEAERVLIPEGRVIVLGFNPWSIWGLRRLVRPRGIPWCGHFLSHQRVTDWLTLLGFDIEINNRVMFMPPLDSATMLRQFECLESFGDRWFPLFSGAYAIRGVKRVSTLMPIEPSWKRRTRVMAGRAVEPTMRKETGGRGR